MGEKCYLLKIPLQHGSISRQFLFFHKIPSYKGVMNKSMPKWGKIVNGVKLTGVEFDYSLDYILHSLNLLFQNRIAK